MSFKFTQTGREFASPRSFVNHVYKHCVKHNLDYSFVVQQNYDLQFGKKFCPHCGKETKFLAFNLGYEDFCFSPDCYRSYVNRNTDYYHSLSGHGFTDKYDNTYYNIAFTKIYFNRTGERYDGFVFKSRRKTHSRSGICKECGKSFEYKSSKAKDTLTCSQTCKIKHGWGIRRSRATVTFNGTLGELPHTVEELNRYYYNHQEYPSDPVYSLSATKTFLQKFPLLRKIKGVPYFSEEFQVWFYKSNTFNNYLNELNRDYEEYHIQHNLGEIRICENCGKQFLVKDCFGSSYRGETAKFCNMECYKETAKAGNHQFRKNWTPERRAHASRTVKKKIASGEWTPKVINSFTKKSTEAVINGEKKYFRSSWEAIFSVVNPHLEYETIRVPYEYNGKRHSYIIDFFDRAAGILYEVKPSGKTTDGRIIAKTAAAIEFCDKNSYKFFVITEEELRNLLADRVIIETVKGSVSPEIFTKFCKGVRYEECKSSINP